MILCHILAYALPLSIQHCYEWQATLGFFPCNRNVLVRTKDVLDVVKPIFADESVSADFKGTLMELAREVCKYSTQ